VVLYDSVQNIFLRYYNIEVWLYPGWYQLWRNNYFNRCYYKLWWIM